MELLQMKHGDNDPLGVEIFRQTPYQKTFWRGGPI